MNYTTNYPRVVHIMSGFGGGISAFIRNKAQVFNDGSLPFDVITFDKVSAEFNQLIKQTGGTVYRISNPKEKGFKVFYNEVNAIFKKVPKDAFIHSHVTGMIALPFYLIAKKNGLHRFGVHAHTAAPPSIKNNAMQTNFKQAINRTIAKDKLSCGVKASNNIYGEKETNKNTIVHIPNSIDYEKFAEEKNSKKLKSEILGINDDRLIIGSIARFREIKNHAFMLEIIKELKRLNFNFVWFFAGDGLLREQVESEVKEMGLSDYVTFLGYREDIPNLFEIMDIFALPSFHEGLPTVVIEAQTTSTTSFISDTITKECDLGINLVKFLSIQNKTEWVNEIVNFAPKKVSKEEIKEKLIKQKFTNKTSAELYRNFIGKEIDSYNI